LFEARVAVLRRLLPPIALGAVACADIAGVDDYAVAEPEAPTDSVAAFLSGSMQAPAACTACVRSECGEAVDACSLAEDCAAPARCMAGCADPPCTLLHCAGASLPRNPGLLALTQCAEDHCLETCELGRSWGCDYDWPDPPEDGFEIELELSIFITEEKLVNATVRLCRADSPELACSQPKYLLDRTETDADGRGRLRVPTERTVSQLPVVPAAYVYIDRLERPNTDGSLGPKTLGDRFDIPLVPYADVFAVPILEYGGYPNNTTRFLNNLVFDCRGSRRLAARGLRFNWQHTNALTVYWKQHENLVDSDKTDLSGIVTTFVGDASDPDRQRIDVEPGEYPIELADAEPEETGPVRATRMVSIPDRGHVAVLVFPPTRKELARATP
jgi:hypothetical protein